MAEISKDVLDFLDQKLLEELSSAELASHVSSSSPTSSKNCDWVHVEIRGAEAPAHALLHIREHSPEQITARSEALRNFIAEVPAHGAVVHPLAVYLYELALSYGWSEEKK